MLENSAIEKSRTRSNDTRRGGIPDILCHFHKYHHLLPRNKSVNKQRRHLINWRAVNVLYVFVPEKEAAQFDSELLLGTRMVATCLRALMV